MNRAIRNLYNVPPGEGEEIFPLLSGYDFRLESIVSRGDASPPGFWYEQQQDEWVVLLAGSAELEFEDRSVIRLTAGDSLVIEAHCRHRVAKTSPEAVWLALHFTNGMPARPG